MKEDAPGQAFTGRVDPATRRILPADWATHVHVLRHGEVAELTERVIRGQLDVPLSPRGVEQHARLARWMLEHEPRPDAVWTSDLVRCRDLAAALARDLGAPLVVDPRLREQSMGAWEGRSWAEISAADPRAVTAYWDDYYEACPTRGESFAQMEARALAAWDALCAAHRGGRVVVVTHIGVIRAVLCRVLGVPGAQALRFAPAVASHTHVAVSEAGAVVELVGERPWLATPLAARAAAPRDVGRAPRVALSGSAGTGKTTLGRRLADALGVPFLEEGMRRRIEQGFRPHGYGAREWSRLIHELWDEQRAEEERAGERGFVADRSSLDFAAFWLHYGLHEDVEATEGFVGRMTEHAARYDRIVLLPWGAIPLVDDGVRSTNRWTQLRFQSLLEGLLDRRAAERLVRVPATEDLDARVEHVLARLRCQDTL